MSMYVTQSPESAIDRVEFVQKPDQNLVFLHAKTRMEKEKIDAWMAGSGLDLREITRTHLAGHEVIVAQSGLDVAQGAQVLQEKNPGFAPEVEKKSTNLWKLRGWASIIGQPMQLFSGMLQKGTIDPATIGFASANMIANITNIMFGAEKKEDSNRLEFLKTEINRDIDEHLPKGHKPFEADEKRMDERNGGQDNSKGGFNNFMKQYSVRIGEIGLRYIGALSLAFPFVKAIPNVKPWSMEGLSKGTAHWKPGMQQLFSGKFAEGFKTIGNADKFTRNAGIAYLVGKSIAFASAIPDPYKTRPHTHMDTLRESIVFPASSVIETVAAGMIAYNGLFKRKINWNKPFVPKALHFGETRDYLGGIGGLLFTAGLVIRIFAPFGKKEVDMKEMTAHITDTLAKTPPQERPRLIADSAATVYEHTRDTKQSFGDIFSVMMDDLKNHHKVDLPAPQATNTGSEQIAATQEKTEEHGHKFADDKLKQTTKAAAHAAGFTQRVSSPATETANARA